MKDIKLTEEDYVLIRDNAINKYINTPYPHQDTKIHQAMCYTLSVISYLESIGFEITKKKKEE